MVAAAVIGSAVVGVGTSAMGAKAAKSAANTQAASADAATELDRDIFQQQQENQKPFLKSGTAGNAQLSYLLGLNQSPYETENPDGTKTTVDPYANINPALGSKGSLLQPFTAAQYQEDPGYQFALEQGNKALQRTEASQGGLLSGAAQKAASAYNVGTANQYFQNAFDRYNTQQTNMYNRLAGISGTGQTAANNINSDAGAFASNAGNNLTSAGNARASGTVGAANSYTSGLSNIGNNAINYAVYQDMYG